MRWMNFAGDGRARLRPFAGLYLRTPGRTRFWGWGRPPLSAVVPPSASEKPFAAVGDWLRAAHQLFGSDQGESAATRECAAHELPHDRGPQTVEKKRRLRFVCNRRVIGFVID